MLKNLIDFLKCVLYHKIKMHIYYNMKASSNPICDWPYVYDRTIHSYRRCKNYALKGFTRCNKHLDLIGTCCLPRNYKKKIGRAHV